MIAFIILNYNTWEMTIKCVDSIFHTCKQDYKIYIVDNGSPNESYPRLNEQYRNNEKVMVIQSENYGYARGNNTGIRQAIQEGHKIITVTNNDVIFLEDSIEQMVTFLEENKDASVVAPYILSPEGELHNLPYLKPANNLDYLFYHTRFNKFLSKEKKLKQELEYLLPVSAIGSEPIEIYKFSGCCFMAKSEMLKEIGLFDENTFLYYEEDIISKKMHEKDYKSYYLPTAKIVHHHGLTTGKDNIFVDTEMLKSEMYFLAKYNRMNTLGLLYVYMDRALTALLKMMRKQYKTSSYKELVGFLRQTWNRFNQSRKLRKL